MPPPAPTEKAPRFIVRALRNPDGANLDRVQIIKGWLDKSGKTHEKVYNVVWSGDRRPDTNDNLPPVGDTVDLSVPTWSSTIGTAQLSAVWADTEFDPALKAFYYVRVIEIPTPRWSACDRVNVTCICRMTFP